jgi:hypothetical protein
MSTRGPEKISSERYEDVRSKSIADVALVYA